MLDEPSLGLAPLITRAIADALVRISEQQGIGLLLVDQSTALALRVSTRAYLIEHGRITHEGATRELLADDRVRASYLGDSEGLTRAEVAHELEAR
jgi:ABC-type branched-subunit amino acid transport system ATPase component